VRVKAVVEYHGAAYAGWQAQPDQPTVQVALENAIRIATGEAVRIEGAGRTDSGVHAIGQVAAFDLAEATDLYRLRGRLNGLTAADISIVSLEVVADDFDPRRDARSRTYRYTVVSGRPVAPLIADRSWHVYPELDLALLSRLAERIVGRHDFRAFRSADCEAETTVRTVTRSSWREGDGNGELGVFLYEISANAFLKHMVRVLVGTMVDVALGKIDEAEFARLLDGPGEREEAGRTAPAHGLVLVRIEY